MNLLSIVVKLYLPTFFSVKCTRLFVFTKPGFPKINRRLPKTDEAFGKLPKIAEDFPSTFEDNRRCGKIVGDFKNRANHFQRISDQSRALLRRCSDDFLSVFKQLHSLLSGVRNWSECVRSQFWSEGLRLKHNACAWNYMCFARWNLLQVAYSIICAYAYMR